MKVEMVKLITQKYLYNLDIQNILYSKRLLRTIAQKIPTGNGYIRVETQNLQTVNHGGDKSEMLGCRSVAEHLFSMCKALDP